MAALWILLASFLFSLMGAAVKLASSEYSVAEIVFYRGLVGIILLYFFIRHQGGRLRTEHLGGHLWRGAIGVVSLWMWFYAATKLPLATAVTLNYMSPIWTAVALMGFAWWRGKERVAPPLLLAIGVSFGGVILALRPAFEAQQWFGALMALVSGMLAAIAYTMVRRLSRAGEPEYRVVFYFLAVNIAAGLAGSLLPGGSPDSAAWHAHSARGAALLLFIGASGVFAQMALTRAWRTGKVLVVANLQYTGIVFSSLWGILIWHDVFDWHVWFGMALILASSIAATFYNTVTEKRAAAGTGD
ncbi:DMT family transporter [Massilia antarctica]|uniref:DMT family transporter n=1 Tax=Massilia antarctica TaxID=2765360 RepID=A0AA49AAL7_9BURK|nr:DMT family transporter [Massilia antarctica]QPI52396.1 DMT family transporter [Massilia antarctica]